MNTLLVIPWFKVDELFTIPGVDLPVHGFGVLVAFGVLLGAKVAEEWGKKNGIHPQVVADLVTHVMVGGFVGAYLGNALFYDFDKFVAVMFVPGDGLGPGGIDQHIFNTYLGLSSYGGFLGSILGLLVWKKRRGHSMVTVGEAALFAFPFGWFFGRTGCFVTHDHPGLVSDFFLAVDTYGGQPGSPARHDLGLYEVIWCAGVIALFLFLAKKERPRGFYMWLICILYAPIRFGLDFLRAPPEGGGDIRYVGLTPGQWGSIALLGIGVAIFMWSRNNTVKPLAADAQWPEPEPEPVPAKRRRG